MQADKEQAAFEGEWKKLGALIDQDKRNRELLRQRAMEERNRKTQEVWIFICFGRVLLRTQQYSHSSAAAFARHAVARMRDTGLQQV